MSLSDEEENFVMELAPDEELDYEDESYEYPSPEPDPAPVKVAAAAAKQRISFRENLYQSSSRGTGNLKPVMKTSQTTPSGLPVNSIRNTDIPTRKDALRTLAAPNKEIVKKISDNITKEEKRRLEIQKMLEIKKEFDKNTKEITSINSLREKIKKNETIIELKDKIIIQLKAQIEKQNGTIKQLETENKIIPDLRKQIEILESHVDSLKEIQKLQNLSSSKEQVSAKMRLQTTSAVLSVRTSSAESRIMSPPSVNTQRNRTEKSTGITGLKISAKSRIGFGRGGGSKSSISSRLGKSGSTRSLTMKERTQTTWDDDCEDENNFDFDTMEEGEELDEVELEREYLGLRCSDAEQDDQEEFQPLPRDLVLTELTEDGPRPVKRKRISAP